MANQDFFSNIITELKSQDRPVKIIFPEGDDAEILSAAKRLARDKILIPVLFFKKRSDVPARLPRGIELFIAEELAHEEYVGKLLELRSGKMLPRQAKESLTKASYVSMMALYFGKVDGLVGGISTPTAEILRPALQIIKTKKNVRLISTAFVLQNEKSTLVFGDCALNIDPTAGQLADIASELVEFTKDFKIHRSPKVAMLSYSTVGSGAGDSVTKVKDATALLRKKQPDIAIAGEIQFDAAFVPSVQQKKYQNCPLKGPANIYVFPNLDAANIGYKIAQRFGGFKAIGPVLLGIAKPVMDLSRGASVTDIYYTSLIVAKQALALRNK